MVVDTSALLAILFAEPHGQWVLSEFNAHAGELRMSTVNLAETLVHLQDRLPKHFPALRERLLAGGITFVAPDADQAEVAAGARLAYPLNLGDCFAYALAMNLQCPVLTLDADFRRTDCAVVMPG